MDTETDKSSKNQPQEAEGFRHNLAIGRCLLGDGAWPLAPARGRFSARVDLAMGRYQLLAVGHPAPWSAEYANPLKSRYDVEYRQVALCIVSRSEVDCVEACDAVSASAANAKYNRDIFTECYEDATKAGNKKGASCNPQINCRIRIGGPRLKTVLG
jgi:hypothetical protein